MDKLVTTDVLDEYRDSLRVGDEVKIRLLARGKGAALTMVTMHAEILEIYPHIARTTAGDFRYFDLYMSNRGIFV